MKSSKNIVESYLEKKDWRVKENSNAPYSFGAMNKYIGSEVSKDYWLREVYPEYIAQAYVDGHNGSYIKFISASINNIRGHRFHRILYVKQLPHDTVFRLSAAHIEYMEEDNGASR